MGGDLPFTWTGIVLERCRRYFQEHGSSYWADLVDRERGLGERFVGDFGPLSLIASYSPLGTNEVLGILRERRHFLELAEEDVQGLAAGFCRVLAGYHALGISTFNFAIYSGPLTRTEDSFRCYFRVVSRQNVYENYRTDDSFLQKLLRYELILTPPEALASALRKAK
jgi:UDPglucose--hexose-1-phosphate uridylyltransferase